MFERFTDRAREIMRLAHQEAQRFNHKYIDTEHILLGLIKEGSGVAAYVCKDLGVDLLRVRQEIENLMQSGPAPIAMTRLSRTRGAEKVIEYAFEESRNFKHDFVGSEHILLGLLREQESIAATVLNHCGVSLEAARSQTLLLLGPAISAPSVPPRACRIPQPNTVVPKQPAMSNPLEAVRAWFAKDAFAATSGVELLEVRAGFAEARLVIEPRHLNSVGIVQGGAIFTLADFAFAVACNTAGHVTVAVNMNLSCMKATSSGILVAEAVEVSRSRKISNCSVRVTDDAGDLVALFQGTAYIKKDRFPPQT